jgi:GNAT superfamily N-acetyltransferase
MDREAVIDVATASEVAAIVPLLATQLEEHQVEIDRAALTHAVEGLVRHEERGAILIARVDGREGLAGLAVLAYTWTVEHGGPCTWLDELYVVPELRDSGLGTQLLRAAMEHARRDGCRAIDLEVDAEHARVESLYLRNGFRPLPRRRFARRLSD